MATTAFAIRDFNPIDSAHAGRTKKDQDKNIQAFKKVIKSFLNLDIKDQQEMKQVLQRLIEKIEVFEEEKIVIHYNLAP